jgi:predicted MFS family arabinose efflux permease
LGSTPIGSPITGWVGQHVGARWAFVLNGGVALVTGIVLLAARYRRSQAVVEAPDDEMVPATVGESALA